MGLLVLDSRLFCLFVLLIGPIVLLLAHVVVCFLFLCALLSFFVLFFESCCSLLGFFFPRLFLSMPLSGPFFILDVVS